MRTPQMKRLILSAALLAGLPAAHAADAAITVYKSPDCGCCEGWVRHMRAAGIETKVVDTNDMQGVKDRLHVPAALRSCHTAVVRGSNQVIEGHAPATAVKKMLANRSVRGIAVPGMPVNSPGMGEMDGKLVTVDFAGAKFSQD